MVSEGLAAGAIQVPPDGQPICLMNDRQTIGGYPWLGTLTPIARARLAQCMASHPVMLVPVELSVRVTIISRPSQPWSPLEPTDSIA